MSAAEAITAARSAGIRIQVEGDDLVLEAAAPPPPAVLDLLSRHKAGILALLRPVKDSWSSEDWGRTAACRGPRLRPAPLLAVSPNG